MKSILIPAIVITTFLLASCGTTETTTNSVTPTTQTQNTVSVQPERKMDIYGKILSMEGNEITMLQVDTSKDPTFEMTPTDKKKYMMAMDESARMAFKEQINSATLGEVKIMIPVGIPMIRKTAQGPDAPNAEASLADVKNGQYISVWLSPESKDKKVSEFVKISFTQ